MTHRDFIIVEGPDGVGKTTVAKYLAATYDLYYRHVGPPEPGTSVFVQYAGHLLPQNLAASAVKPRGVPRGMVWDRFYLGERVYGPEVRGFDGLGVIHQRMLERILLGLNAFHVRPIPYYEVGLTHWSQRVAAGTELVKDPDAYNRLWFRYHEIFRDSALPVVSFDHTEESWSDLNEAIRRTQEAYPNNQGPGIGRWRSGNILLVGDRVNVKQPGSYHLWPFVGLGGSSYWLTERLEEWGISEDNLYWVNVNNNDPNSPGQLVNPTWLKILKPSIIVALGREAQRWCQYHKVKHVPTTHPAAWKRFHSKQPYPLKSILL